MNYMALPIWTHLKSYSDGCGAQTAGNGAVRVEPIFHPDWRGCVIDHPIAE